MSGADDRRQGPEEERGRRGVLLSRLEVPPGLCASCRHLRLVATARSAFVRCGLAATDPSFPRYPRLPVVACPGYREEEPAGC